MKVPEYIRQWRENKKPDLDLSTYEAYVVYTERHIIPYFERLGKQLEDLTPLDVQAYVTWKRSGGRLDGKRGGLSPVSVRKHLNIIKQAFREAQIYGLIDRNPAEPVKMKRSQSVAESAQFLPLDRVRDVLNAMQGTEFYPLVYVTLIYGLRRSEVIGLQWGAVDFESKALMIRHTVVKNLTIEAKDKTKTSGSRRIFPLLPDVEGLLEQMRKPGQKPSDYIFSRDRGVHPFRPDCVTRGFQRVLKRHGLHQMRFHDLRHATASILFDRGWSVPDVQHWLGHSDIETTMNIYVAYNAARKIKLGGSLTGIFS